MWKQLMTYDTILTTRRYYIFNPSISKHMPMNKMLIIFVDRNTTHYFSMLAYFLYPYVYLHICILIFGISNVDINHGIIYISKCKCKFIHPQCVSQNKTSLMHIKLCVYNTINQPNVQTHVLVVFISNVQSQSAGKRLF